MFPLLCQHNVLWLFLSCFCRCFLVYLNANLLFCKLCFIMIVEKKSSHKKLAHKKAGTWYLHLPIFRWGTHLYMLLFPSVCPSVRPYVCPPICRTPYLRNRTLSNHNFWCTCIKWWYLQTFFHFLEILIFWAVRRIKGQKIAQNEK